MNGQRAGEETFRETLTRLAAAQKSSINAPAYSRYVNRPLGRLVAAGAFHAGLTPNAVTAVSAALSMAGILVLALAPVTWATGIAVAVLLALGYAADAADGQLARLRGGGSPAGEWLDHVVDSGKLAMVHLAVLVAGYRADVPAPWLLAPIAFCVASVVLFAAMLINDFLAARHGRPTAAGRAGPASARGSWVRAPIDYGTLICSFVLLGWPPAFAVAYLVQLLATLGYLGLALPVWFRKLNDLGR